MRNPLDYYKEEIKEAEKIIKNSTIEVSDLEELSEEEIIEQNQYIIDFIVKQ